MARINQKLLDLIREAYEPQSAEDVQEALKDLTLSLLYAMGSGPVASTY